MVIQIIFTTTIATTTKTIAMTAIMNQQMLELDDWETQDLSLDLGTDKEPTVDVSVPETEVSQTTEVAQTTEVSQTTEVAPVIAMLTPATFIGLILIKSQKTFQSQRGQPAYKRTVRQYNVERDMHIPRMDIIRDIIAERAVLANGFIMWKHPWGLRKYKADDPALRDPGNWVIRTSRQVNKDFVKHSDIHVEVTKSVRKMGGTLY
jgi:hypothetical protein